MNVEQIPKVELHRHLELSIRHSTLKELAPQFGMPLADEAAFRQHFIIDEPMKDLGSVLNKFLDTQKLLATPEILERITYEACEDAHNENIKILELRYAPTFVKLNHDDLTFDSIHQAIVKGMNRAKNDFHMSVGLICIIQRILPVKEAEAVTQFAIDNNETFVGLDLADNEEGFDSKPFSPFFKKAREAGLGITVHAGEANLPKAPRYVKDAMDYLGATRIGHGVQIHRDPEMVEFVKDRNVTLELCPTSNVYTQAVSDVAAHPFRKLMEQGVKTTLNSDDPGIFDIDLNHEYKVMHKNHDFTMAEFERLNDWAASASFIPMAEKQKYWPRKIN